MTDETEQAEKKRAPKASKVGSVWQLKVAADPDTAVVFHVTGPTGIRRVSAHRTDGKHQVADFILDAPGDFTAVAHIDGADNVGGFAVTAK